MDKERAIAEARLADLGPGHESKSEIQAAVEKGLRKAARGSDVPKPGRVSRTKRKIPVLIKLVTNLIHRNPSMPFSVSEIASAARMTPNHFSTLFHSYTGQSFLDFLTEERVALAKGLLEDLTMNIAEVAVAAGFEDPSYFARRFKQKTGVTPTEWRNTMPSRTSSR